MNSWQTLTWPGKLVVTLAAGMLCYMLICTFIVTTFMLAIAW